MKYTNNTDIPLPLAVWLLNDDYDYNSDPKVVSATTIIKPLKQIVMASRVNTDLSEVDISSYIASKLGTAIHDSIEKAWKNPKEALQLLGYPESVINKIIINPTSLDLVFKGEIPVYMEQRIYKDIGDHTISGKFDFIFNGLLMDYKTTSTITWMKQSNTDKYRLQGSIYRWINPDIITEDYMEIQFIFTDWSSIKAKQSKDYPQSRLMSQKINLLSIEETEQYVKSKLRDIKKYKEEDQDGIPECTDEDLWIDQTKYAYYKNPKSSRATKVFNEYFEAHSKYIQDGSVGSIIERKGEARACRYCSAINICNQAKQLKQEGRLFV